MCVGFRPRLMTDGDLQTERTWLLETVSRYADQWDIDFWRGKLREVDEEIARRQPVATQPVEPEPVTEPETTDERSPDEIGGPYDKVAANAAYRVFTRHRGRELTRVG